MLKIIQNIPELSLLPDVIAIWFFFNSRQLNSIQMGLILILIPWCNIKIF